MGMEAFYPSIFDSAIYQFFSKAVRLRIKSHKLHPWEVGSDQDRSSGHP